MDLVFLFVKSNVTKRMYVCSIKSRIQPFQIGQWRVFSYGKKYKWGWGDAGIQPITKFLSTYVDKIQEKY